MSIHRCPVFAHRLTRLLQIDAVALVHQTIEDRVGQGGFSEVGMPGVARQLVRDERGASVDAVVEDFQQVRAILRRERGEAPVIQHDEGGFGEALQELDVAAVAVRDAQLLDQARHRPVEHRVRLAARLLRERAGDPRLARAGRAGDEQVLGAACPLAAGELGALTLVEPAGAL